MVAASKNNRISSILCPSIVLAFMPSFLFFALTAISVDIYSPFRFVGYMIPSNPFLVVIQFDRITNEVFTTDLNMPIAVVYEYCVLPVAMLLL